MTAQCGDPLVTDHTALGPGREFDAIRALLERWGARASGIGNDAAAIDVPPGERLLVSTDTSVENVHFRREWLTPEEIGWRATMSSLSDLAACAARPLGVLTAISVPPAWRNDLPRIADGIGAAVEAAGTKIVGGDLDAGGELSIGVTVLGSARKPSRRSGASPGDTLFVTGTFGGPAAALRAWLDGEQPAADARARFAHPVARIAEAQWLAEHGATAAIDISDGLVADARHLAAASGWMCSIELDRVPVFAGMSPKDAAASGEEYELLVAAPATIDRAEFERRFKLPLTPVGKVWDAGERGRVVVYAPGGTPIEFTGGHDHFSRS